MHLLLSTDEIKKLSYLCWDDAYIKHLQLESHTYFRVQMLPSAPKKKKSSHLTGEAMLASHTLLKTIWSLAWRLLSLVQLV